MAMIFKSLPYWLHWIIPGALKNLTPGLLLSSPMKELWNTCLFAEQAAGAEEEEEEEKEDKIEQVDGAADGPADKDSRKTEVSLDGTVVPQCAD